MAVVPSHRTVGPSSRRPGSGPVEGTTYRALDALTPAERNERAADCWAWASARGRRRTVRRVAYLLRWFPASVVLAQPPPIPTLTTTATTTGPSQHRKP